MNTTQVLLLVGGLGVVGYLVTRPRRMVTGATAPAPSGYYQQAPRAPAQPQDQTGAIITGVAGAVPGIIDALSDLWG